MVSETWFSTIESTILTTLKYNLTQKLLAPYPNLKCTTSSQVESMDNVKDFPTLYVHMLPPLEVGQDLTNETVNAINCTFEVEAFSDKSETECSNIIISAIKIMKSLKFNINMFPDPQSADKRYFALMRCNRVIGNADEDIVPRED